MGQPSEETGSRCRKPAGPWAWEEPENPSGQDGREGARRGSRKLKDQGQAGGWEVLEGEE